MKKKGFYHFITTVPDRLYPFAAVIEGKKVRGMRSYQRQLEVMVEKYGIEKLGYKLMTYRQAWHLIGSLSFIVVATIVSDMLFGSDTALYVLLGFAILAITYQEFYLHPRTHGQKIHKGVLDWAVWTLPILLFIGITNPFG